MSEGKISHLDSQAVNEILAVEFISIIKRIEIRHTLNT